MSSCDAIIIGAGPAGLFAAFQLGIHGLQSVILDSASQPGGQCAALYADKPIYDLPGLPAIDGEELVRQLSRQVDRFKPKICLSDRAVFIQTGENGRHAVQTASGQRYEAPFVIVATGLGPFGRAMSRQDMIMPEGLAFAESHIEVDTERFESAVSGIFAIGDAVTYPGKLCLLVSAFHEAALMAFAIRKRRAGEKRVPQEYSSTSTTLRNIFADN